MVRAAAAQANTLVESFGQPIKQYPGQVQVTRAVKVKAPGKHFNGLTGADPSHLRCRLPPLPLRL